MATGDTHLESDGKAVNVDLLYTVLKGALAVVDGWVGVAGSSGDSGDSIALAVDDREYQVVVPSGLAVSKGDILYIESADVTGHTPDDTAYTTSPGAGKVAFMKATADKSATHMVTGIMLAKASFDNVASA